MTENDIPRCRTCKWYIALSDTAPHSCFRFPEWAAVYPDHYCGEHRAKDDPILNPHE